MLVCSETHERRATMTESCMSIHHGSYLTVGGCMLCHFIPSQLVCVYLHYRVYHFSCRIECRPSLIVCYMY